MARQTRAVRTRDAVIGAAAHVFASRGYEAATIAEILERAGVTKGALYFHFSSKQELAEEVMQHAFVGPGPDQTLVLQRLIDTVLLLAHRLCRDPLLRAAARLAADQSAPAFFGRLWASWAELVGELLAAAQEKGEVLPAVDPSSAAETLVAAFTGVHLMAEARTGMADLPVRVSYQYTLLLSSIARPAVLRELDFSPARAERIAAAGLRTAS